MRGETHMVFNDSSNMEQPIVVMNLNVPGVKRLLSDCLSFPEIWRVSRTVHLFYYLDPQSPIENGTRPYKLI